MSLAVMACGSVVLDRYNSHNHVGMETLRKALRAVTAPEKGNTFASTVDLGSLVGLCICVATNPEDDIVYAQRPRHSGKTRFVLNKKPFETSNVSFVLTRITNFEWLIQTAYFGSLHPPEPFDTGKTPESLSFWKSHALVWGYTEVIAGSMSKECPW